MLLSASVEIFAVSSMRVFFIMYYSGGALLLHFIRLHCSDLHRTAVFSHTLHPTALTFTVFCSLDYTAPTFYELHGSVIHCCSTLWHWPSLLFDEVPCTDCTALHCTVPKKCKRSAKKCQRWKLYYIGATIRTRWESVSPKCGIFIFELWVWTSANPFFITLPI